LSLELKGESLDMQKKKLMESLKEKLIFGNVISDKSELPFLQVSISKMDEKNNLHLMSSFPILEEHCVGEAAGWQELVKYLRSTR